MTPQPDVSERFKTNVLGLASNFKAINNSAIEKGFQFVKREITIFVEAYLSRLSGRDMLQTFAEYSHMYWGEISHRDTIFFEEHAESVFDFSNISGTEIGDIAGQPKNIVLFKQLLTSPDAVTEEDKDLFWRYFEAMVRITWKAILEDESTQVDDSKAWIPREIRRRIFEMEDVEGIIERVMERRSRK